MASAERSTRKPMEGLAPSSSAYGAEVLAAGRHRPTTGRKPRDGGPKTAEERAVGAAPTNDGFADRRVHWFATRALAPEVRRVLAAIWLVLSEVTRMRGRAEGFATRATDENEEREDEEREDRDEGESSKRSGVEERLC